MIPPGALLDQWIAGRLIASGLDPGNSAQDFRAALEAWQTSCLAATLRHAGEHSLYYRRILPLAASLAEDLESRAAAGRPVAPGGALAALPFTWPQDLAADPEGFLAVSLSETEGVITSPSSGSSGEAKRVYSTAEDLQSSVDFFSQGMRFLAEPGDRVAMLMSGERPGSVGDLFARAMRRAAIDCLVLGPVLDEEETLRRLAAFRPHCLVALPAQALALARHPLAAELSKRKPAILLSADFVSPGLALAVEKGLGGPVFIHYGMTETGLAGAVECPERRGCHSREGDLFLEIVDEYGRTHDPDARSGATRWGEITVTTLTRRAMPLLRYRTGDLGRLITRPCPCGSALYRLEVQGRLSGTIPPRGKPRI
ncbi:MAG: AMP-binding protein, partial [Desulfovibrio sp.]|nr:AMP-binding protein [Desulfovibrio sp.]